MLTIKINICILYYRVKFNIVDCKIKKEVIHLTVKKNLIFQVNMIALVKDSFFTINNLTLILQLDQLAQLKS